MDNSKVLKPIIGPQESAESKKKEGNKKKKALIVAALAFLIATGTIAASIAVVKANMPKLLIKFDQWFVDSFDKESIQRFIDDNRLSEQSMFKQLPGYVDRKAKDQNVKNADAIYTAKFTDKVPNDKSNKFPPGVYIEMTAEDEYSFEYQADLSLEDNKEETRELSKLTKDDEKQTKYFISSDKTKLYILVYERPVDNDITNEVEDLQTFNDYEITNIPTAFEAMNTYINQKPRRYTQDEFAAEFDYDVSENKSPASLEIFYEKLIGLERKYILNNPKPTYDKTTDTVTIYLNNKRSNFDFIIPPDYESKVSYDNSTGILTLTGFNFFSLTEIKLDTLFDDIQEYIKEQPRRYTLEEFRDQMGDDTLRDLILNSVDPEKDPTPKPFDETITDPDVPEGGDGTEETPPPEEKPQPGKPKIRNMFMRGKDLVISFECDEGYKYQDIYVDENNRDDTKYSFDTQNDELTVKGLKYFTEYTVTNTAQAFHNLDQEIIKIPNQYTVEQFKAYAEGNTTTEECKELIASALRTDKGSFNKEWITSLSVEQETQITAKLKIQFDTDFKKYKTNNTEQYQIDSETSSMEIRLTFFKEVEMDNLQKEIQDFIDVNTGQRYTLTEFQNEINAPWTTSKNLLQQQISNLVENSIQDSKDVRNFRYLPDTNELKLVVTISKYDKFPTSGTNISYTLLNKNADGTANYEVTITNLEYWFDFEITDDNLKKTRNNVAKYIENNGISISTDPEENNYDQFARGIFDKFGETPLENGQTLGDYMIYDDQNYKRNDTTFIIDLSSKLSEANRCRGYKVNSIPQSQITFNDADKTLTFSNFEFTDGLANFIVDKKEKVVLGVSELGKTKKTLNFPGGYIKIDSKGQERKFTHLENLQRVTIPDSFEYWTDFFLAECPKLEYVKMSRNFKYGIYSSSRKQQVFYNCENLLTKNIDWNEMQMADENQQPGGFFLSGLKDKQVAVSPSWFTKATFSSVLRGNGVKKTGYNAIITNLKNVGAEYSFGYNYNIKAVCFLNSSLYFFNEGSCDIFRSPNQYPNVKFYVTNANAQSAILRYFNYPSKVIVMSDLKQKLVKAGYIPEDY